MNKSYRRAISRVIAAWDKAQRAGFAVGRAVDAVYHRYSRGFGYPRLAADCRRLFGRKISRQSLQSHHRAYLLWRAAQSANRSADLTDLDITMWIKAATCCPELTQQDRIAGLRVAAARRLSASKLRDWLVERSGEKRRRKRSAEPVRRSRLVANTVLNAPALELIRQLQDDSVSLCVCDWSWSYGGNRWGTVRDLPAVYPQGPDAMSVGCKTCAMLSRRRRGK